MIRHAMILLCGLVAGPAAALLPGIRPMLSAQGIRTGPAGKLLPFGTPRAAAMQALREAFGPPLSQRAITDCGQGVAMREATFRDGLVVTLLRDRFSGWTIAGRSRLRTDRAVALGSSRAALRKAHPHVLVMRGTLGKAFVTREGVNGFLAASAPERVTALYAGQTCIAA